MSSRHLERDPLARSLSIERLASEALDSNDPTPSILAVDRSGCMTTEFLPSDDPVAALMGRVASDDHIAIGLRAPASISPTRHDDATSDDPVDGPADGPADGTVVHLVDRTGTSITIVDSTGTTRRFGPTAAPQNGRVPDACRRMFGLTTPAPDVAMTSFVLSAWLEVIAQRAAARPGMEWPEVVGLHPAASALDDGTTPAGLARATRRLGESLDWERFRSVIASVGGFPFGDDAPRIAAWMDAGMFSRWAMDQLPDRNVLLEVLDAVLCPVAFDHVWATIRLVDDR